MNTPDTLRTPGVAQAAQAGFAPLFFSHGSPMIALHPGEAGRFMQALGRRLDRARGRPDAVLAISAHTTARQPVLLGAARHETIHDFGGFPAPLYALRYDAPGAPALAQRLSEQLGLPLLDRGGLDHGIWTVLRALYPDADVPVLPLALPVQAPTADLFELGRRLAQAVGPRVLVMGTGSITHNLGLALREAREDAPELPESAAFRRWFAERSAARDWAALRDYRRQAPHAQLMHPTDEHLLPWYVAAGAGGEAFAPQRLYEGVTLGSLGMDLYAFGPQADALKAPPGLS
ncbi:dioxygenase [Pelomonas sp. CA6]|uniref:dioxygenase family protein n=1 Tax=Pelomonas sp. CA6 TaxID=2907999 RepID=UPI001F4C2331|nr:dioxygenase [Pelomonas sp. CA6]MCH7345863.1 dioxygenase [Pelomonas sp. CA6]